MEAGFVQYSGTHPEMQGNQLLHHIMNSRVRIVEGQLRLTGTKVVMTGDYGSDRARLMDKMAEEFRRRERNPVILDVICMSSAKVGQCGPLK